MSNHSSEENQGFITFFDIFCLPNSLHSFLKSFEEEIFMKLTISPLYLSNFLLQHKKQRELGGVS